jgi:hypothetical protein
VGTKPCFASSYQQSTLSLYLGVTQFTFPEADLESSCLNYNAIFEPNLASGKVFAANCVSPIYYQKESQDVNSQNKANTNWIIGFGEFTDGRL